MKNLYKKVMSLLFVGVFGLTVMFGLSTQTVYATSTYNNIGMYDGLLVAEISVGYGDWSSVARYTGKNPYNLERIAIQTQIVKKDGSVALYWEEEYDYWVKYDGGSNSIGANGSNYARAYGYFWGGGDKRVATSWI